MTGLAFLMISLGGAPPMEPGGNPPTGQTPSIVAELAWDQRLNAQVPLDLQFRDEMGHAVTLRQFSGQRPMILVLAYYRCPQLCNLVLNGLLESLREVAYRPGQEFEIVIVSFDARETPEIASAKRDAYVAGYARPGTESHWHFLTGDASAIATLAESVGFRFRYDAEHDRFDHPAGFTVLTPDGRVSRYLFGIRFEPRDLRLSIVEASAGNVGSLADQVLLFCFHYDPIAGKYNFAIFMAMRIAAAMTVSVMAWLLIRTWRRDAKSKLGPTAAVLSESK
jgi:protein SCO1/2